MNIQFRGWLQSWAVSTLAGRLKTRHSTLIQRPLAHFSCAHLCSCLEQGVRRKKPSAWFLPWETVDWNKTLLTVALSNFGRVVTFAVEEAWEDGTGSGLWRLMSLDSGVAWVVSTEEHWGSRSPAQSIRRFWQTSGQAFIGMSLL